MTTTRPHRQITVEMWPHWPDHPYLADLFDALWSHSVVARPSTIRTAAGSSDVVHVQWPDAVWSGHPLGRIRRTAHIAGLLVSARLRRRPVVVTVHNLGAHENTGRLGVAVERTIVGRADAVIVLSESGRERAASRFPNLDVRVLRVVPLPDWTNRYRALSRDEVARVGVETPPGDGPILVWFGRIRRYKGLDTLLDLVEGGRRSMRLIVLGASDGDDWSDELTARLHRSAAVTYVEGHVSDDQISAACSIADLAVFPFTRIENSASVVTALAVGVPVLAPANGALSELALEHPLLDVYDGTLTAETICAVIDRPRSVVPAELRAIEPIARVAARHRAIYDDLVETSPVDSDAVRLDRPDTTPRTTRSRPTTDHAATTAPDAYRRARPRSCGE